MTGWIVYEEADALKNQEYIRMFTAAADGYGIPLQLLYVRSVKNENETGSLAFELYSPQMITSAPQLPDFVINRSRNAVLAQWLEQQKVRVFNPAVVTDICNDKQKTYQLLAQHGIRFMETVCHADSSYPLVIKPSCGHGGHLVRLVHDQAELTDSIQEITAAYQEHPGYILQRCASDIGRDLRVYVLGGEIIASVMRSAYGTHIPSLSEPDIDIRSNYSLGHSAALHTLTNEEEALVHRILPLLPFDCIGIDFVYDKGHPVFNEIEDAVGARMLYSNSEIDLVQLYMDYIIKALTSPHVSPASRSAGGRVTAPQSQCSRRR